MNIFEIFRIRSHPAIAEPTMDAIIDAQSSVRMAREHIRSFDPLIHALSAAGRCANYHPNGDVTLRAEDWRALTDALGKIGGDA